MSDYYQHLQNQTALKGLPGPALRNFGAIQRSITFRYHAPQASHVALTGSFNHWNASSHPMQKGPDGYWQIRVELKRGRHEYRFIVDGIPTPDPKARAQIHDTHGSTASVIEVGH